MVIKVWNGNSQAWNGSGQSSLGTRVSHIFDDSGESSWVVVHIVAAEGEEAHEYQQAVTVEEMMRVAEGESLAAEPALVLRAREESRGV